MSSVLIYASLSHVLSQAFSTCCSHGKQANIDMWHPLPSVVAPFNFVIWPVWGSDCVCHTLFSPGCEWGSLFARLREARPLSCWTAPNLVPVPACMNAHTHTHTHARTRMHTCTQTQMGPETLGTGAPDGELRLPGCVTELWVWSRWSWGHSPEPFICHGQDTFSPLIKLEIREALVYFLLC